MTHGKLENPFQEYGYFGPEYFCDRKEETENLITSLRNGSNITLIAPRRIGKTGLIMHTFEQMRSRYRDVNCFYVDIFATKSFQQMVQLLATAIIGKLDTKKQSIKRKLDTAVSSFRPTVSFDKLDGTPNISFNIVPEQAKEDLQQIFEYIRLSEKTCYLAIDEFQQVLTYSEYGVDAYIRSLIQQIPNLHIIFSGSQQHLLADMFMSPKHPFFNSSQIMPLKEIDQETYRHYANNFMRAQRREFSEEVFAFLYQAIDGQTWYVQKILNRLYRYPKQELSIESVNQAIDMIIAEQEITYQNYYNLLTENQARLMKAVAEEGIVKRPTAIEFMMKYQLPTASSISVALKSLCDKELLYHDTTNGYLVYDRFFAIWLQRIH